MYIGGYFTMKALERGIMRLALAFLIGCAAGAVFGSPDVPENQDGADVNSWYAPIFTALGATTIPDPVYETNDGLIVKWQLKSKVYNDELILVDLMAANETDPRFADDFYKDVSIMSNIWTSTTITNDGYSIEFRGQCEDKETWQSHDGDAGFRLINGDESKFTPEEWTKLTNNTQNASIYKTTTFNGKLSNRYDRVTSVTASGITNRVAAINAYNDIVKGLKRQQGIYEFTNEDVSMSLSEGYYRLQMSGGGGATFYYMAEAGYPNTSTAGSGAAFDGIIHVKSDTIVIGRAGGIGEASTIIGITCGPGQKPRAKKAGVGGTYDQGVQPSEVEIYGTPTIASGGNTGLWKTVTKNVQGADSRLTSSYNAGSVPEYGQGRGVDSVGAPSELVYKAGRGFIRFTFIGTNPPN